MQKKKIINNVASVINHASFMVSIHKIYMMIKLPNHSMYEMQNIAKLFHNTFRYSCFCINSLDEPRMNYIK